MFSIFRSNPFIDFDESIIYYKYELIIHSCLSSFGYYDLHLNETFYLHMEQRQLNVQQVIFHSWTQIEERMKSTWRWQNISYGALWGLVSGCSIANNIFTHIS